MCKNLSIESYSADFTKQIQLTKVSLEGKVQSIFEGSFVKDKSKVFWRSTEFRVEWSKRQDYFVKIFLSAVVANIKVLGELRRALEDGGNSTDDHKFNIIVLKNLKNSPKVCHGQSLLQIVCFVDVGFPYTAPSSL